MTSATSQRGVVVGVDGSPAAQNAVAWAARAAAAHHQTLTLVHLLPPPVMVWPGVSIPSGFENWQESQGRNIIQEAVMIADDETRTEPIHVDHEIRTGLPVPSLTEASKQAAMVVVGAHGRGRLRRVVGSVTSGLIQHAGCPVAVIHDDNIFPDTTAAPVVVGIDGSPYSEPATAIAFDEASCRGVDLVAVHACSDWSGQEYSEADWSALEQHGHEVLAERLAGWQERYPDVKVHRTVVANRAAEHLIEQSEQAQLVVVGSHGRGACAGILLGSVSSAVVQSARVPVIVARKS